MGLISVESYRKGILKVYYRLQINQIEQQFCQSNPSHKQPKIYFSVIQERRFSNL